MRYVVRVDMTTRIEKQANITKYEILSIVVQRILGLLQTPIRNINQNHELKLEERIVLCHVAIICHQMVAQLSLFDWTEKSSDATFNGDYPHNELTNE